MAKTSANNVMKLSKAKDKTSTTHTQLPLLSSIKITYAYNPEKLNESAKIENGLADFQRKIQKPKLKNKRKTVNLFTQYFILRNTSI